jgi:3-deoxy-manno-octulosonate cytidylyltransferase (CMP-KDO synthetase)
MAPDREKEYGTPVLAVIPARYASVRFPGKPLADISGKPMIRHVWERVRRTPGIQRTIIATDDERIRAVAEGFGAEVRMTSPEHPSGTDRMWEVAKMLPEFPWILNVQGDEPFLDPCHLQAVLAGRTDHPGADILTLVAPLCDSGDSDSGGRREDRQADLETWRDPNIVKAVLTAAGKALYFSRAPVPYRRECPDEPRNAFRHLGLYLYRRAALQTFVNLPVSPLEALEKLEQLRALEAGLSIHAMVVDRAPVGVDTPEDLIRILDSTRLGFPSF